MKVRRIFRLWMWAGLGLLLCAGTADSKGIKEDVPRKYQARYETWKNEFLATEIGRRQWSAYQHNDNFTLTIRVASDEKNGAGTGSYEWDSEGRLVAATITLGAELDSGYPNPVYYPVMNSLAPLDSFMSFGGNILAGAKMAHEFGHVNRTSVTDSLVFRRQTQLMTSYNKILLSNKYNTQDPRLLDLARQMGGTPVQIWEDREYWSEVNAMRYLRERITKDSERRTLFSRIRRTVETFAGNYAARFEEVAEK